MKWLALLLCACGVQSVVKTPSVTGWIGDASAVPVIGPFALACKGPCQGSLASSTVRADDENIAITFTNTGTQWVGVPKIRLAYGTHYALALPTSVQAPPLAFTTEPDPTTMPTVSMWPTGTAPANLAWIVLTFSPAVERAGVLDLLLTDGDTQIAPAWVDVEQGMVERAILWGPFSDPRCSSGETEQLCAGTTYTLTATQGLRAQTGAPLTDAGRVVVGEPVTGPLTWESFGAAQANDAAVRISRAASANCLLSAATPLVGNSGPRWPLAFASGVALANTVTPASDYVWSVICRDAAGNQTPIWSFAFQTLPLVSVGLSEVVVDPLQDWNDSSGAAGAPYDAVPGIGSAGAPDAYAELFNSGSVPADVSTWHLRLGATGDEVLGDLWQANPIRACGTVPLAPGERAVVRLAAPGSAASAHAQIVLVDGLGLVRDHVTLGSDGVPDGSAADVASEAVSRCPDEGGPWQKTVATPGAGNACAP